MTERSIGPCANSAFRNIEYNLERAQAFAQNPTQFKNLLRLRPDQPVGNWRDSNNGLGYGVYPYDVNGMLRNCFLQVATDAALAALMPAALRAIEALSQQDVIESSYRSRASSFADTWERHAHNFFLIKLNQSIASDRLNNFVDAANLSTAILNGTQLSGNTSFYALSLKDDGKPVEACQA